MADDIEHVPLLWDNFHQVWTIRSWFVIFNVTTADTLCHTVTFTSDPLNFKVYVHRVSRNQNLPNLSEIE